MLLAKQLTAAGIPVFPCRADKVPAVLKGESWKEVATRPVGSLQWPSGLVGVPIPTGAVIIDLDTYKGASRESVEAALGCRLNWDAAHLQTTPQGGQHYAFGVNWKVKFGSSLADISGLDTRTAGHGYICAGTGAQGPYTPAGPFGLYALAYPDNLPQLPDACRPLLEHVAHAPVERQALPEGDPDIETLKQALAHVDPGCTRTEWVRIGNALRNQFHADEVTGYSLFAAWSAGEYWTDGEPANHDVDRVTVDWDSFKPEGGVTIATLFYEAMQQGWTTSGVDATGAFSTGSAPDDLYAGMHARITESGGDPQQTDKLMREVQALTCNPLQRAMLLAALDRSLKEAGLLTKGARLQLDAAAGVAPVQSMPGAYSKSHTHNAQLFASSQYPEATILYADETWYHYTGKVWELLSDGHFGHTVFKAMESSKPQNDHIEGTVKVLRKMCHTDTPERPVNLAIFDNGVLDLTTWQLHPHSPQYFSTTLLPYNYDPQATCPRWEAFMQEIFEGDLDRIALLQEWFGYNLTTRYDHQKVLLLLGPPRCGKGTIGKILHQLVGPQNFTGGSLSGLAKDSILDLMRDKTVMFVADAEKNVDRGVAGTVTQRLKEISGNDEVIFERKYKPALSVTLPTRITLALNGIPNLFDDSGALSGRLMMLPMYVSHLGNENLGLYDELYEDIEGIATWAMAGLVRLTQQGRFTTSVIGEAEGRDLSESYSPLQQFLREECTLGSDGVVESGDLYDRYRAWAVRLSEGHILSRRKFINVFKDATRGKGCRYGPHRVGEDIIRGFKGITLNESDGGPVGVGSAFTVHEGGKV